MELQKAGLEARAAVATTALENVTSLARAKNVAALADLTSLGLGPGNDAPSESAGEPSTDFIAAPIDELARDSALLAAWRRAGALVRSVKGIVHVEEDGASPVVLALDPQAERPADLPVLLGEAFPDEDAVVLPSSPSLLDWVTALVAERAPDVQQLDPVWTLEERDGNLDVLVGSRTGRGGTVVKAVLGHTTLIVPTLSALLLSRYDSVSCGTAYR